MARPTKAKVIEFLTAQGVEFSPDAKFEDLMALYMANKPQEQKAVEPVEDRITPQQNTSDGEGEDVPNEEPRLKSPTQQLEETSETGDYLQKYQYKKQTPFGSVMSNPSPGSKADIMKKLLLKQSKIRMFIPRAAGEDPKITLSVCLNGYRLDLPKQVYIEVPMQVAEIIADSQGQTDAAILRNQISESKEKEHALS